MSIFFVSKTSLNQSSLILPADMKTYKDEPLKAVFFRRDYYTNKVNNSCS